MSAPTCGAAAPYPNVIGRQFLQIGRARTGRRLEAGSAQCHFGQPRRLAFPAAARTNSPMEKYRGGKLSRSRSRRRQYLGNELYWTVDIECVVDTRIGG